MARFLHLNVPASVALPPVAGATAWAVSGAPPGLAVSGQRLVGTPAEVGRFPVTAVPLFADGHSGEAQRFEIVVQTEAQFQADPAARRQSARFLEGVTGGGGGLGGSGSLEAEAEADLREEQAAVEAERRGHALESPYPWRALPFVPAWWV